MAGNFLDHAENGHAQSEEDREDDPHRGVFFEAGSAFDREDEEDAEESGDGGSSKEAGEAFGIHAESGHEGKGNADSGKGGMREGVAKE